jgi:hypothetical protein
VSAACQLRVTYRATVNDIDFARASRRISQSENELGCHALRSISLEAAEKRFLASSRKVEPGSGTYYFRDQTVSASDDSVFLFTMSALNRT